jgi:dynein regulatory complex protein 1
MIIEAKDRIIKTFSDELQKKDDEYGKMIKEQAIDISSLIRQMRS